VFGEGRRYDRERRNTAALRFPHRSRDLIGLGPALTEEISIDDGAVQQSNFYDYTVMRMRDVPEIYVELIPSDEHPSGVRQMPVTVVAPARRVSSSATVTWTSPRKTKGRCRSESCRPQSLGNGKTPPFCDIPLQGAKCWIVWRLRGAKLTTAFVAPLKE